MRRDHYATLGLERGASQEEVRRAYRQQALQLHPDRNGGSREAEEAFKQLTEAYAVLGDPSRRAAYDAGAGSGPSLGSGDLFADLCGHPHLGALFQELARTLHGQGIRFHDPSLRRVFALRGGGAFFGGFVFVAPSGAGPAAAAGGPTGLVRPSPKPGLWSRIVRGALPDLPGTDVSYALPLSSDLLSEGGTVRVSLPGPAGAETYQVRIPAGCRPGTRLRLRGRGAGRDRRGDLYLELQARAP